MLKDSKAFASFSTDDLARAKDFYANTLGLDAKEEDMGILSVNLADNNWLMIYPKENHEPATYTVMNFLVDDIEAAVDELIEKGISFEQYDMEYIKTNEKGIAEQGAQKMAWFTDPAGNILSLIEEK